MTTSSIDKANDSLQSAVDAGALDAATIHVRHRDSTFRRSFGKADSIDAVFLIASISKPICVAGLMKLFDEGHWRLNDPVSRFIPELRGGGREAITIEHLLTHRSGLPDQLAENAILRQQHSQLSTFVDCAVRAPLSFPAGTRYQYSSMGILLAMEIAQRIADVTMHQFMQDVVFKPMRMHHTAIGLGSFQVSETMQCQIQDAAPESGGGDPSSISWNWNSDYWRRLGAPWGGVHSSAPDIARFLDEFLHPSAGMLSAKSIELMTTKRCGNGVQACGIGFSVGSHAGSPGCSSRTFGHHGVTGTIGWADPDTDTVCVILTTLPENARTPHPRDVVSGHIARAFSPPPR